MITSKLKTFGIFCLSLLLLIIFIQIKPIIAQNQVADPLPSWNQGTTKQSIITFIKNVTDPSLKTYIPPSDRIATFDNDGTLWIEKPLYIQLEFVLYNLDSLAPQHPEWQTEEPFKTLLTQGIEGLKSLNLHDDIIKLLLVTHTGMSDTEFTTSVNQFFVKTKHPRFNRPYNQLIYQPMLELINYLKRNEFDVYICSGGGIDFIRTISEKTYGIPPQNVIGTAIEKEFIIKDEQVMFIRQAKIVEPINDKVGKPVNINRYIGKKPVIAVGNSDGDIQMLQYADSQSLPDLELLLHHDDSEREYDYNEGTEKALQLAKEHNWTIISLKKDFKQVFPF